MHGHVGAAGLLPLGPGDPPSGLGQYVLLMNQTLLQASLKQPIAPLPIGAWQVEQLAGLLKTVILARWDGCILESNELQLQAPLEQLFPRQGYLCGAGLLGRLENASLAVRNLGGGSVLLLGGTNPLLQGTPKWIAWPISIPGSLQLAVKIKVYKITTSEICSQL